MKENLNEIHAEIAKIQSLDRDGITKTFLSEIPELADNEWEALKKKMLSGAIRVHEMAISPVSFQLLAGPSDRAGFKIFNTLAILVPVGALLLAVIYSWWFTFLALGVFIVLRTAKSFYRTVIFQGVTASETVFCYFPETRFACSKTGV